jgi:hypothetical protein
VWRGIVECRLFASLRWSCSVGGRYPGRRSQRALLAHLPAAICPVRRRLAGLACGWAFGPGRILNLDLTHPTKAAATQSRRPFVLRAKRALGDATSESPINSGAELFTFKVQSADPLDPGKIFQRPSGCGNWKNDGFQSNQPLQKTRFLSVIIPKWGDNQTGLIT